MGILTKEEKATMLNSGFLQKEIDSFDSATTPSGELQTASFGSAAWQRMIMSRRTFVKKCHEEGIKNDVIRKLIYDHYQNRKDISPWDFLKIEYQPIDRGLTDAEFAKKLKIRSDISKNISGPANISYSSFKNVMDTEFRPKGYRKR
jgi:hypothetical protein